jgi:hypothetical protein
MIPLKIRQLFRGFWRGRLIGATGLIFATACQLAKTSSLASDGPAGRLTNLLTPNMVNQALTLRQWWLAAVVLAVGN